MAYLEQLNYITGYDNIGTVDDPNSADWNYSGASTQEIHLRFQIAETSGAGLANTEFALFCSDTNDPSAAFQVTTAGSANMEPVEIADSVDLSDGIQITDPLYELSSTAVGTWINGYFIDASNSFPAISFGGNNYTEIQACITFTGYASYGTYYFWIKQLDGTALDNYDYVASITIQQPYNTSIDTSWELPKRTSKPVSWKNKNAQTKNSGWSIRNTLRRETSWWYTTTQDFQSSWKISNFSRRDVSWKIRNAAAVDFSWRIFHRTYDVELRLQSTGAIVASDTGLTNEYYVATGLQEGTNYEWRVRSVENEFVGTWSDWLGFTTLADTGVARLSVSWRVNNIDNYDFGWRIKRRKNQETAWASFTAKKKETAWGLAVVCHLSKDVAWKLSRRQDKETAWGIRAAIRDYFLLINNLGGGMIHKLTAGLGGEVRLSVLTQLSQGRRKAHQLFSSIAGEAQRVGHLQLQAISETDSVHVYLKLLTALDDPAALYYSVSAAVYLDGRPISARAKNIRITFDEGNVHNEIVIEGHDPELFAWADPNRLYGEPRIEAQVGSRVIQYILETREGERSNFAITGVSMSAREDAPYAPDMDYELEAPTLASEIAASLTGYCALTWDVEDWMVPTDFTFSGKPLDGIQKLASEVGAIVRCQDDGSILVRRRRPVRPVDMDGTNPDVNYSRQTLIALAHAEEKETGYNAVRIFGQSADAFKPHLVLEDIAEADGGARGPLVGETCYVRVYWAGKTVNVAEAYTTDGSISRVGPADMFYTEDEEQIVEFNDGAASVSLPIYDLLSYEWIGDSGGDISWIQHSTDLSIAPPEGVSTERGLYRVARVRYRTRFQRYMLEGHNVERLIAVLYLATRPDVNVSVRTAAESVYGDPVEASLLTTESALVERGKAWIDKQYRKSYCDITAPYDDAAVDGNLAYIDDAEIGAPGNYHVASSEIVIEGPKVTNNLRVEKCLIFFNS